MNTKVVKFKDYPVWLLDRLTAMRLVQWAEDMQSSKTPRARVELETCPRCGADYIAELGHNCKDVIRVVCEPGSGSTR